MKTPNDGLASPLPGASREGESARHAEASLLVEIFGQRYWLLYGIDEEGPIAKLEHCDKTGELHAWAFLEESFAHWFPEDDAIMRLRQRIGGRSDIHPAHVERTPSVEAATPPEAKP